ncbi:MAG: hypothetical protein MI741_05295 [Rhodospirillales bacterium]|nr:hypothetical protein [Rhodospirillales bacterium]
MFCRTVTTCVCLVCMLVLTEGNAAAEDKRYGQDWQAEPGHSTAPEAMIDELRALIDEAASARAADPLFLRDLRDLAQRYSWPWRQRLLFDDFSDGNFSQNPHWSVAGRNVVVDRFAGVRSRVVPPRRHGNSNNPERLSNRDLAAQFFSAIIQQQAGGDRTQAQGPQRPAHMQPVKLTTDIAISNAFALRIQLASENRDVSGARFEFGVTQGPGDLGYRIAYNPGSDPSVELLRIGSRGIAVIDASRQAVALEDGALHELQFTRSTDGTMAVSIDQTEIIRTLDRSFREAFDGVAIVNKGGDFTVRAVTVYGR